MVKCMEYLFERKKLTKNYGKKYVKLTKNIGKS